MPELIKHCTFTSMIAYAGATWDWHRLHYDMQYLKSKGLDRPVVDGQVFGAYAVQAVQDWLGVHAFLTSLDFRYANLVFSDERVKCTGEVSDVRSDGLTISLKIDVIDDAGNTLRPAVDPIRADIAWVK